MSHKIIQLHSIPNLGDYPVLNVALVRKKRKNKNYYTVLIHGMASEYSSKVLKRVHIAQLDLESFKLLFSKLKELKEKTDQF